MTDTQPLNPVYQIYCFTPDLFDYARPLEVMNRLNALSPIGKPHPSLRVAEQALAQLEAQEQKMKRGRPRRFCLIQLQAADLSGFFSTLT